MLPIIAVATAVSIWKACEDADANSGQVKDHLMPRPMLDGCSYNRRGDYFVCPQPKMQEHKPKRYEPSLWGPSKI